MILKDSTSADKNLEFTIKLNLKTDFNNFNVELKAMGLVALLHGLLERFMVGL